MVGTSIAAFFAKRPPRPFFGAFFGWRCLGAAAASGGASALSDSQSGVSADGAADGPSAVGVFKRPLSCLAVRCRLRDGPQYAHAHTGRCRDRTGIVLEGA